MTANDLRHDIEPRDPDPLTPEERYDEAVDAEDSLGMFDDLRDMIASLDAEIGRLTDTVNAQDTRVTWLEGAHPSPATHRHVPIDSAPDTVAVPASLAAEQIEALRRALGAAASGDLMAQVDFDTLMSVIKDHP